MPPSTTWPAGEACFAAWGNRRPLPWWPPAGGLGSHGFARASLVGGGVRVQPHPEIRITGTGAYLPERVVDNRTLETLIRGYDSARSGDFGTWVDQVSHIH